MPIDSSIYQTIQPITPVSPMDSMSKALTLSNLGLQNQNAKMANQQMQYQMQGQQAMRDAYRNNTDESGNVNRQGVLSDIAKVNPTAAIQMGQQWNAMDKAQAEKNAAQADAASKTLNVTGPAFDYLAGLPGDQRAAAYPKVIQQLKDQGIDVSKMDHPYDPSLFNQYYGNWQNSKESLANQVSRADIGAKQAEAALAPVKLNSELYGSRSPNAELSSQYNKDVAPVRNSQVFMNQMMDAYKNKTPQGDAALVLANFKIRNPQAVDVNSLDEMKNSQTVGDKWKNKLNEAISGGFDDNTRANLMRDGISAYRANYDTLQGIQKRYQARASAQNVNDRSLTYEPAIDDTYKSAMGLQDKIGPYVPPSDRGGFMSGLSKIASKITGSGGNQSANAGDKTPNPSGMIKMMSPTGRIKLVPVGMKGEAIAAGGKVVP